MTAQVTDVLEAVQSFVATGYDREYRGKDGAQLARGERRQPGAEGGAAIGRDGPVGTDPRAFRRDAGLLQRDAPGAVVGEHVFVGLYAMHVYHVSTIDIPVVRSKVAAVRAACGFAPGSYRDKALLNTLETFPREELIEIGVADLQRIATGIVLLQEHPRVRVFLRDDSWGRYVSALVYMPRDRFDTTLRRRITTLLKDTLRAESVDLSVVKASQRSAS